MTFKGEIYTSSLLKCCCKRPAKQENLTLADWAAWYNCTGKSDTKQTNEVDIDGLPLEKYIDNNQMMIIMMMMMMMMTVMKMMVMMMMTMMMIII